MYVGIAFSFTILACLAFLFRESCQVMVTSFLRMPAFEYKSPRASADVAGLLSAEAPSGVRDARASHRRTPNDAFALRHRDAAVDLYPRRCSNATRSCLDEQVGERPTALRTEATRRLRQ